MAPAPDASVADTSAAVGQRQTVRGRRRQGVSGARQLGLGVLVAFTVKGILTTAAMVWAVVVAVPDGLVDRVVAAVKPVAASQSQEQRAENVAQGSSW